MARRRNPARLVIALSVAAVLAIFLLYTSLAAQGTPSLQPSQVAGHDGRVSVVGNVVGPARGDGHDIALRFRLRDRGAERGATVPVVYHGTVPDLFKVGREVVVEGSLQHGTFVADSLVTKCPSKYAPSKKTS